MTAHDWYIENRIAFVTRALEESEAALFTSHVSRCEECQQAVAALERDLAWLPMGVTPVAPRPGLTRQLAEGALRKRTTRWWQRAATLAATAVLLVALNRWADARSQVAQLSSALTVSRGQVVAMKDSLAAIVGAERVLQESVRHRGHVGGFLVFYDRDTERWNVVVHDLPPAAAGEAYQLWFVTKRGLVPGPQLPVHGQRPTFLTLPTPGPSGDVVGAVLCVGPPEDVSDGWPETELARVTF